LDGQPVAWQQFREFEESNGALYCTVLKLKAEHPDLSTKQLLGKLIELTTAATIRPACFDRSCTSRECASAICRSPKSAELWTMRPRNESGNNSPRSVCQDTAEKVQRRA